ncbi:MAG: flagellar protein FlbD [Chitinivibrionales bacterium]|nr:flagellar protein FlbD [Chitinivibrionales bacterium]
MIALRRLNGEEFVLNADYIESMESTPDSIISLTTGKKVIVRNSLEDIVRKTVKYKQLCNQTINVVRKNRENAHGESGETGT